MMISSNGSPKSRCLRRDPGHYAAFDTQSVTLLEQSSQVAARASILESEPRPAR